MPKPTPPPDRIVPAVKRFTAVTIVERATDPTIEASATITTDAVDREGDIVNPKGMKPLLPGQTIPVLFGHDHSSLPIGVATSFAMGERGIRAGWRWATHPVAKDVEQLWIDGFLNATSIGFRPLKAVPSPGGRGLRFESCELLEFSIVPVPANPEAVRALKRLKLDGPVSCAQASVLIRDLDTQLRSGKTLSETQQAALHEALVVFETLVKADSTPPPAPEVAAIADDGSVVRIAPEALAAAITTATKHEIATALSTVTQSSPGLSSKSPHHGDRSNRSLSSGRPYGNASAGLTKPALSFSFRRYDWPRMLTVMA